MKAIYTLLFVRLFFAVWGFGSLSMNAYRPMFFLTNRTVIYKLHTRSVLKRYLSVTRTLKPCNTRKPCCRKETARCCSYSGRFSLPCCCISFSCSYKYDVDFSTLLHRCVVFLVTYMLFEMHQKWPQCCFRFRRESQCPECCKT